ncbi:MAG: alpha/beta fold hydrolase [Chloroflexaceae bacterium]
MVYHDRITVNEHVRIEYLLAGADNDQTILFIPGLGAHLEQFRAQIMQFRNDYRTLAVSLRGHGQSTYPPDPTADDFAPATLGTDIRQVLAQLDIPAAHVVGNSAGGLVGYELLATAPQVVRSLTTFGTAGELHAGVMGKVIVLLDQLLGPRGNAWIVQRVVLKNPAVVAQVADMIRSTPKPVIVNLRRHLDNYNYLPTLQSHPDLPFLLIQGEHDTAVNRILDTTIATLKQRRNAEIVHLADAGHFANLDQPAAFNQALAAFLHRIGLESHHA